MSGLPGEHGWSEDALYNKALVYVQKMEQHDADDWEYGFWSSLSLEFLCRATVAHISPTLLADQKDWRHTHYALGNPPIAKKFVPKSADSRVVLEILEQLVPGFVAFRDFCTEHLGRRNAELHSGDLEFQDLKTGAWLPRYYGVCKTLLTFLGKGLSELFKDAEIAEQIIVASQDADAKALGQDIATHAAQWAGKDVEDKAIASSQADLWASREKGHRTRCLACENVGLLRGNPQGLVTTTLNEEMIVQKQTVIPTSFECIACGLKVVGLSKLLTCGLANTFTETSTSSAAEFFGLYTEDEMEEARSSYPDFADDNND